MKHPLYSPCVLTKSPLLLQPVVSYIISACLLIGGQERWTNTRGTGGELIRPTLGNCDCLSLCCIKRVNMRFTCDSEQFYLFIKVNPFDLIQKGRVIFYNEKQINSKHIYLGPVGLLFVMQQLNG